MPGQDHRAGRRRLDVRVRQPGVHRPHRQLDRERREEGQPEHDLQLRIEVVGQKLGDRGRVGDPGHGQDRRQHQDRAQQRVEEELVGGVDAALAAPDPDDQEHRDQLAFEEQVEDDQVERAEDADHQRLEHQERDHVLEHAVLDRRPAGRDAERQEEGGQQDEQDREAVDPHAVAEAGEPGLVLDHLEAGLVRIEIRDHHDREREGGHRRDQRDPARGAVQRLLLVRAAEQRAAAGWPRRRSAARRW